MTDEAKQTSVADGDSAGAAENTEATAAAGADAAADAVEGKGKGQTEAKATSVTDDAGGEDERVAATNWPDDWRQRAAGEDKSVLKALERYADPAAALKALPELRKKLSERSQSAAKPGEDASEEEIKEWRAANGLPEAPDKYELKLRDNRALGDDDKPVFDDFAKAAFEADLSNDQMSRVADWYLDLMEKQEADLLDQDTDYYSNTVRELKEDWGPSDYKKNIAAIRQIFADAPEGIEELVLGARMPNGRKVGGDAQALRFLANLASELYPGVTLLPNEGGDIGKGLENEIAEIEKVMRTDARTYWKDSAMQDRYRELLAARDRQRSRAA